VPVTLPAACRATFRIFCSLRFLKLKTDGHPIKTETSPKSYKTEIKVLANPGLTLTARSLAFLSFSSFSFRLALSFLAFYKDNKEGQNQFQG